MLHKTTAHVGLTERLAPPLRSLADAASHLDRDARPPQDIAALLHAAGALAAPLPRRLGGLGLGVEPEGSLLAAAVLRQMGQAWLPLGRLFEGHVNALRLVFLYGTNVQRERAAADAHDGHLFAVWIAEASRDPVRIENGVLVGPKTFASGADVVTRALVTFRGDGERLAMVAIADDTRRVGAKPDLLGMRGAGTAAIDLTGVPAPPDSWIGAPGDYMRQPEITLGSWRPLAVLAGGMQALTEALGAELSARGRSAQPQQRARIGACLVAQETAWLWAERAGHLAETQGDDDAAAYVQLARLAVDAACSSAIQLAQRSAGLAAFARPHPIERLCRDLATYQRQPALDEVVDEAAAHFSARALPA